MIWIYIIELAITLILSSVVAILTFKNPRKTVEEGSGRTGGLENNPKISLRPLALIILLLGAMLICIEFVLEKPQIKSKIEINAGTSILDTEYRVKYHGRDITADCQDLMNLDTSKLGEYTKKIVIPYRGGRKNYSKTIKVNVVDKLSPVIVLEYKDGDKVSYKVDLQKEGYTVEDNLDKDLKEKVTVVTEKLEGNFILCKYSVEDNSGNLGNAEVKLEIVDDVPPVITLNGSSSVNVKLGDTYNDEGITALDENDGDVSNTVITSGHVDTSKEGTYTLTYNVKDKSGNEAKIERTVTVSRMEDSTGVIYLTFDDGPSGNITPGILDILKRKGVKATFFIINYSDENEYLVRRIVDEGHTVAIHGYSHDYAQIYTSADACHDNITRLQEKIKNTTGVDTKIVRFPGGGSNTVSKKYCIGVMSEITKRIVDEGYLYYDWNVDSNDAGGANTSAAVYNNVINGLSKERSNVVLMHDAASKNATLGAVEDIIDYGLSHGYTFERITENTPMVRHRVGN